MFRILRLASAALLVGGIAFVGTAALGQDAAKVKSQKRVKPLDAELSGIFFGKPREAPLGDYSEQRKRDAINAALMHQSGSASNVYIAGAVGGANNCTDQTFIQIITIGGADPFDPATRSACNGSFVGGGAIGANFGTPFISPFFNAPIQVGVEVQFLGSSGGSNTFQGTPTNLLGPLPGEDSYIAQDNYFVIINATATVPITPVFSLIGHAGYAWANKTVTYNCTGLCPRAGQPESFASQDVTLGGFAAGGGLQFELPQAPFPIIVQLDYTHLFLNQETVQFGTPATVFTSFNVGQDVDLIMLKVEIPIVEDHPSDALERFKNFGVPWKSHYQDTPAEFPKNRYRW